MILLADAPWLGWFDLESLLFNAGIQPYLEF